MPLSREPNFFLDPAWWSAPADRPIQVSQPKAFGDFERACDVGAVNSERATMWRHLLRLARVRMNIFFGQPDEN
jgi:hypothetical protein